MLVDSHCHLDFPHFSEDLDDVIARARDAGVHRMVTICTRPGRAGHGRAIAERYDAVYFAVGLHPAHVGEEPVPSVEELVALADHPKMAGIGETGLDFYRGKETAEEQGRSLLTHIEAARRTGLPLIIHARAADEALSRILCDAFDEAPYRCVLHCFASGIDLARKALQRGFYLSMSGIATFKSGENVREAFREAPIDRILVETDAPYLAPAPHRSKRNEPAFVRRTALAGAQLKGMEEEAFAAQTTENFFRLFDRVPRPRNADAV